MALDLGGIAILEKDKAEHVLLTWQYPSIDDDLSVVVQRHSGLKAKQVGAQYNFLRFRTSWVYLLTILNKNEVELNAVEAFSIAVVGKTFNPEKFLALTQLLATVYTVEGSPPAVLKAYLSVFARGQYDASEDGIEAVFDSAAYDPRRALIATSIKDVVRMFGKDAVLIWTAMMMRKRLFVFSETSRHILRVIRAFPIFVWHRQDWSVLHPLVDIDNELEIEDLKKAGVYCAGTTNGAIGSRQNLYDVFVDVDGRQVTVADHAKEDFILTPLQREIGNVLATGAENEEVTDQQLIKALVGKTQSLLQKIDQLKGDDDVLTASHLQEAELPSAMSNLVYAIA
eukprot:CAMPEP_0119121590 /NCGR_PEP_ID=MMETSP1310-20130426/2146_1 /TAXON_ID=464262 /ORGANISM="Genus nov. species nov., Strain RCC2339" /LENGTH=340 /DNA_ID=CAMNT_0007111161 /DNA_START=60 /DNA_END=1078 /DNA_ORIENTATION=-